ncbi:MAG: tetratricopeptide repeat protein [Bradymonadia bacterium]
MNDVCRACGASKEQRVDEPGPDGAITPRCRVCGALWLTGAEGQDTDGPIDTVSRQPAFKVPVNTIDAPDPESVEDESNFGSAQATTPNDILLAAHRTKPLSRAVDAQIPGGRRTRKKPPPLPPQGPTGTTTGMVPPSLTPATDVLLPDDGQQSRQQTSELEGDKKLVSDTEDFPPVPTISPTSQTPDEPAKATRTGGESVRRPHFEEPEKPAQIHSIADAVAHLQTSDLPQVQLKTDLDFKDEVVELRNTNAGDGSVSNGRLLSFLFGVMIASVSFVIYQTSQSTRQVEQQQSAAADIDLMSMSQLTAAAALLQQDTESARADAETILRNLAVPQSVSSTSTAMTQAARLLLVQLSLDRAQTLHLLGKSKSAELNSAEEWLNPLLSLDDENLQVLAARVRLHRLAKRFTEVEKALSGRLPKRNAMSQLGQLELELSLNKLPESQIDPSGRLMGLNRLSANAAAMPTVWALRLEAALAARRFDIAEQILNAAPEGKLRAFLRAELTRLKGLKAQKNVASNHESMSPNRGGPSANSASDDDTAPALGEKTSKRSTVVSESAKPITAIGDQAAAKRTIDNKNQASGDTKAKSTSAESKESKAGKGSTTVRSRASESDGDSYKSLMREGARLLENGRASKALEKFEAAAEARPKDPDAYVQIGWCHINRRAFSGAVRMFKRALSLRSQHRDALFGLGVAHEKLGEVKEAVRVYETYLKRFPGDRNERKIKFRLDRLRP